MYYFFIFPCDLKKKKNVKKLVINSIPTLIFGQTVGTSPHTIKVPG